MRAFATLSLALLMVIAIAGTADAKRRKQKSKPDNVSALLHRLIAQNEQLAKELDDIKKRLQPDAIAKSEPEEPAQLGFRNPVISAPMPIPLPTDKTLAGYEKHIAKSAKLKDLVPGLATKTSEILGACNTHIASAYRRGARVAGSGRPSLHSLYPSQAVDLVGDPSCIYAHLKKWAGGYSVDYRAVRHVHVSLSSSGRERGARFVHYRSTRYARHVRKSHRYAMRPQRYEVQRMHYAVAQ